MGILHRLLIITHSVIFLFVISGCSSSETNLQRHVGTLADSIKAYIDGVESVPHKIEVRAESVRNYGAYFLENQGFDTSPLICEISGVNINDRFTQISEEYTLNALKVIISLKVIGSITLEFLRDFFLRIDRIRNAYSVTDFYIDILNQIEIANLLDDKYMTHRNYLRAIDSNLDTLITNVIETRKSILEYTGQSGSELFCKNLYEAKFLALEQNLLIVKTIVNLLDSSDTSKLDNMFRGENKALYATIADDKDYLSSYYIGDFSIDTGNSLLECIKRSNVFEISDLFESLNTEVTQNPSDGSIFGKLLNTMAGDSNLAFSICKRNIEKLLKEIEFIRQKLVSKIEKGSIFIKSLNSQFVEGIKKQQKYELFREYKTNGSGNEVLADVLNSSIEADEINNIVAFVSEVLQISQDNMNKIVSSIKQEGSEQSLGVFLIQDLRFSLSIFSKQYVYIEKLKELDEVLKSAIDLNNKVIEAENKAIRLLNFIPIFHILTTSRPQDENQIKFLKEKINEYSLIRMIEEEYKIDSSALRLDQDITEFISTLISNVDETLEYSCKALKDYYEGITSSEIKDAIKLIDHKVSESISHYNNKNHIFISNVNSLGTILGLSFLVKLDTVGLGKLISTLLYGGTYLTKYIDNYLALRKCVEKVENENSLKVDLGVGLIGLTISYLDSLSYIKNSVRLEKEVNSVDTNSDLKEITEQFSIIYNIIEYNELARLYFSGPVSQVASGKAGIKNSKLSKKGVAFIYDSIMTNDNKLFKIKGLTPILVDKKSVKERLHFLFSIFSSYKQLLLSLDNFLKVKSKEYNSRVEGKVYGFYVSEVLKLAVEQFFISLKEMFNSGFVGNNVLNQISECINVINDFITPEYAKLFTKMYDLSNSVGKLVSIIISSDSMVHINSFLTSATDSSVFGTDTIVEPVVDNGRVYVSSLNKSNYPGSIMVKKSRIRPQESESNCRVAYIDLDEELYRETSTGSTDVPVGKYNVVTIHCIIQNSPGRTLDDFLKIRSSIKSGGFLDMEGHVIDFLTESVQVTYLAVDHTLANSNVYIEDLEMELNQYFLLVPGLNIDYVVNLDTFLFSIKQRDFNFFKDIINYCLDLYMSFDPMNSSVSRSFLRRSNYVKLLHSTNIIGNPIKVASIGKYSGFGGETPLLFSFAVVDHNEDSNIYYLKKLSRDLFQESVFNCITVLDNIAPFKSPSSPTKEYVWVVTESSHVSYMMLLRNKLINEVISGKLKRTLYVASLDVANQAQISNMNAFFNSLIQRESSTNMFYDITKNKIMFLVDNNLDISKKATDIIASLKMYSHKNFFENVISRKTEVLNVPVFQIDMKQAVDQYVVGSMPLYCSARRNYYDNSVVLSITENLKMKDLISYRLLLRTLDSSLNLRVRNLPSQTALREIFSIGYECMIDINNLKYTYILPVSDPTATEKISEIKDIVQNSMRDSSVNSLYPSILEFTPEISLSSIGLKIISPEFDQRLKITPGSEIFTLNGISYYVIRYNSANFLSSLEKYVNELLLGRENMIFTRDFVNLDTDRGYLPQNGKSLLIHLIKSVPIELVEREHVIKIYTEKYDNPNVGFIHNIMKIYKGYNVSIITKDIEHYYIYKLCFNESNTEKECTFINVFRYVQSNIFEKLIDYQKSLNLNQYFSVIAEENEIISEEMIGLNVISRFGGSVLFRAEDRLELSYYSYQYWDACAFVKEYYEFSTELPIVLINHDPAVQDIVVESTSIECPVPPIRNLPKRDSIPHFVRLEDVNRDGISVHTEYIFTLYKSFNYQILANYIEFHLAGHDVAIQIEGFDSVIRKKKLNDVLDMFSVYINKNNQGNYTITLKNISLSSAEIQSVKMVVEKLQGIFPNSEIVAVNTRNEVVQV